MYMPMPNGCNMPPIADKIRFKTKAMINTTTIIANIFIIPTLLISLNLSLKST